MNIWGNISENLQEFLLLCGFFETKLLQKSYWTIKKKMIQNKDILVGIIWNFTSKPSVKDIISEFKLHFQSTDFLLISLNIFKSMILFVRG